MKALLCALVVMTGIAPAWADEPCTSESEFRAEMAAPPTAEVVDLLGHSGTRYLFLPASGVVVALSRGCVGAYIQLTPEGIAMVLRHTEGT